MDDLFYSDTVELLFTQLLGTYTDDFLGGLRNNLLTNTFPIFQFAINVGGVECREMGVRGGALLRKSFSYQFLS